MAGFWEGQTLLFFWRGQSGGHGHYVRWRNCPEPDRFYAPPIARSPRTVIALADIVPFPGNPDVVITVSPARFMTYREHVIANVPAPRLGKMEKEWIAWLPLVLLPATAMLFLHALKPWIFMWTFAFALFFGCKWLTWWHGRTLEAPLWRNLAYLFAWPGMDAAEFLDGRHSPAKPAARKWLGAVVRTLIGVFLLLALVPALPASQALLKGWLGMFAIILILHFGTFELLALVWQACGIQATPLMNAPIKSRSLAEFWGRRWNSAFNRLVHDIIFRPLCHQVSAAAATMLVFLVSGIVHDLILSVPARGGYGLPTAYFLLQGAGLLFERSAIGKRLGLGRGWRGSLFTIMMTAFPAFWLFHPPFVRNVILPMLHAIGAT